MFLLLWAVCQQILYLSGCCRAALETVDRLTESLDFTDYASRIIHPIVRTLDQSPELRSTAMDTLSSLVFQLGKKVRWESSTHMPLCLSELLRLSVCRPQPLAERGIIYALFPFIQQVFIEPPLWAECCSGDDAVSRMMSHRAHVPVKQSSETSLIS